MAATQDIVATYRGPGRVMRRLMGQGVREDRALIYLMVGCLLVFVAQTPRLAREAFETGSDLQMLLGGTLLALIFIAPLLLYLVAGLTALVGRVFRSGLTGYGARLSLFWAWLAASPIILLWGLTAGFVGPGIEMTIVGALWFAAFMWFWVSGLIVAGRKAA
ncbi:YIP1 family protein [Marimonas sp. MJW-29]|uniref:YIP1 family protein n=1 Tax=Sulfitobacter sediminis TaxID=3234186 RepID=A0ABV3RSF4_9RHOB